ncbi:hypothetical protein MCO_00169 [Bartonella sp. DB5-6]|nr:hypothetical protein MCO_00169 [Bartonella sp. DB5-6]
MCIKYACVAFHIKYLDTGSDVGKSTCSFFQAEGDGVLV